MSDYVAEANKAGEQYLTTLAKAQDDFVAAIENFVKQIPAAPQAPVAVPAVDLPSATDVTAFSFDFAEKLLANQRISARDLGLQSIDHHIFDA